ncbi:glycosyltransferase family 4 protein [Pseudotabrizicola alkalilacus]|uniref:Glycosyltransferase family 1 protein n=1 Tax=Pseudotabrizicola alkalilacus TaxID=2305252 RepID=A0A411Z1D4_9RHOB|nr:glycosyltransferase family 4 protein [Pseudotabrizicola alkalilacus]RGP36879.1 glycosyltransferase family 1 protein [Pseudotabrizicola alkalilacus]
MMQPVVCEGFFDAGFYQGQLDTPVADPLGHFRAQGDRLGLDPSPYFSTRHYKARYPDWAADGHPTALDSFLAQDRPGAWRSPHPLIDPVAYLRLHPDVAAAGFSPAGHFARHGDAEGRSPTDAFDAVFYRRCYLRLQETYAFAHYIRVGQGAGHLPRPVPRSPAQSAAAARQVLAGIARPILLGVHDAQEAGTPILVRDMAQHYAARGLSPVFVLRDGGPLVARYAEFGPVFVLAEGWDAAGLFAGVPRDVPVIVNSGAAALLAQGAAQAGLRTVLLIHEMRGYLDAQGLVPGLAAAQAAGARLVASFPRMAEALRPDLGPLDVVQPGVTLPPAGLADFRARKRVQAGRTVFIGAGHADRRKGFDLFLDAAQEIAARMPQAGFVWLGALDPWAQDLARAARGAGLPLSLPGFVTDSLACYAAASVYLLTSREDPGPATLIHAAATGTPFVGYAADIGLRGTVDPLGRFVASGDRAGFVAAAIALAQQETQTTRRARRALVRPHLGLDRYCDQLLRAFA